MFSTIQPYLPLLIPIITVPILMRLIIAPLIIHILKSKHIKLLTSTIKDGWIDDKDLEAIEYLKNHAWKGLSSPFVISYNIVFLQTQIKTIFLEITKIYCKESENKINLEFSIQKILESLYLFFEDIHKDLKKITLYKFLEKLPIDIFLRVTKLNNNLKIITQNRVFRILNKYRISTKVLRLLLTPILGFPIILTQLIFSLLYTTLFEGYMRFIYGLILIKIGYYTIYAYSDRNSSLHKRLNFSHKELIKRGEKIEERHTKFKQRYTYTPMLEDALITLKQEMEKLNLMYSRETSAQNRSFDRLIKRFSNIIKNTIDSELDTNKTSNSFNLKPIISITNKIGKIYFPKRNQPLFSLRVKEFIELGYFLTNLLLKSIYTIPTSELILDKIPLKLVININDFINDKKIKKLLPEIKKGTRIFKNVQNYYWTSRFLIKRSNPLVFAASVVTPVFYQQFQDSIKEYVYNNACLLLIDSYEATILKEKKCRITNIFN